MKPYACCLFSLYETGVKLQITHLERANLLSQEPRMGCQMVYLLLRLATSSRLMY